MTFMTFTYLSAFLNWNFLIKEQSGIKHVSIFITLAMTGWIVVPISFAENIDHSVNTIDSLLISTKF